MEIALREFGNLSSAELGRICGVSHTFVDKLRAQQPATNAGSPSLGNPEVAPRQGADGKVRKLPERTAPAPAVFSVAKPVMEVETGDKSEAAASPVVKGCIVSSETALATLRHSRRRQMKEAA